MLFTGSCLCGQSKYQVVGDVIGFYHCHCNRCRKFTGTGHATNLRIDCQHISWLQGERLIKRFKLNRDERYRNDFCLECGSPMPRYFSEVGFVVIPAGSLDHEIDIKPSDRIFCASRAAWSCEADGITCHDE